eukprot:g12529.t1
MVVAGIQRALTETVSEWTFDVPLLFWVAVSRAHMVAELFRQVRLVADGHVNLSPRQIVKGLARWIGPVLPEVSLDNIDHFLMATRLDRVVEVYVDHLVCASRLGLDFSKDCGTEQPFNVEIHSEMNRGLLRVGERCLVVVPDILQRAGASGPSKVLSKRYVLPTQALEEDIDALRRQSRQGASGTVSMAPFPSETKKNGSAERDADVDADADADAEALKDFALPVLTEDEWLSLIRAEAGHNEEPLVTPLCESPQNQPKCAGGDLAGVKSSEKPPVGGERYSQKSM